MRTLRLTSDNLLGFDEEYVEGETRRVARQIPTVDVGVRLYDAMRRGPKARREKAKRAYLNVKKRSARGSALAGEVVGTVREMARVELERRRKRDPRSRQDAVAIRYSDSVSGFDFGNFMKDVGKVAGPIAKSLAPMAKFVPFVGPVLEPALNVVADASAGKFDAKKKVARVKRLAAKGNKVAKRDLAALKMAAKLRKAAAQARVVRAAREQEIRRHRHIPFLRRFALFVTPYKPGTRRFGR